MPGQAPSPRTATPFPLLRNSSRVIRTGSDGTGCGGCVTLGALPWAGEPGGLPGPRALQTGRWASSAAPPPPSWHRLQDSPAGSSGKGLAAAVLMQPAEAWTTGRGASLNPPRSFPQLWVSVSLASGTVLSPSDRWLIGRGDMRGADGPRGRWEARDNASPIPTADISASRQHLRQHPDVPHGTGTRATVSPRQP